MIRKNFAKALRAWSIMSGALPRAFLTCLVIGLSISQAALGQTPTGNCGELGNGTNGPFDYRVERGAKLQVVEQFHFSSNVERLVKGDTGSVGSDLDYTLRAFPNHHRALMSMIQLGVKLKSPQPTGARYSVECYFQRALSFRPDDNTARMIYATFLFKNERPNEASQQLETTKANAGDSAFTHYNIGLIYFDGKIYDQSLIQAHRAMEMGFGRTELRDMLKGVAKWQEPNNKSEQPSAETPVK